MEISIINQHTADTRKEATAISVMRSMLISFSEEKGISFEQAMLDFSKSKTYCDLFDYTTEIWKEGPRYLKGLYLEEIAQPME